MNKITIILCLFVVFGCASQVKKDNLIKIPKNVSTSNMLERLGEEELYIYFTFSKNKIIINDVKNAVDKDLLKLRYEQSDPEKMFFMDCVLAKTENRFEICGNIETIDDKEIYEGTVGSVLKREGTHEDFIKDTINNKSIFSKGTLNPVDGIQSAIIMAYTLPINILGVFAARGENPGFTEGIKNDAKLAKDKLIYRYVDKELLKAIGSIVTARLSDEINNSWESSSAFQKLYKKYNFFSESPKLTNKLLSLLRNENTFNGSLTAFVLSHDEDDYFSAKKLAVSKKEIAMLDKAYQGEQERKAEEQRRIEAGFELAGLIGKGVLKSLAWVGKLIAGGLGDTHASGTVDSSSSETTNYQKTKQEKQTVKNRKTGYVTSTRRKGTITTLKCSLGNDTKIYRDSHGECSDNYSFGSYPCDHVLEKARKRCENRRE